MIPFDALDKVRKRAEGKVRLASRRRKLSICHANCVSSSRAELGRKEKANVHLLCVGARGGCSSSVRHQTMNIEDPLPLSALLDRSFLLCSGQTNLLMTSTSSCHLVRGGLEASPLTPLIICCE